MTSDKYDIIQINESILINITGCYIGNKNVYKVFSPVGDEILWEKEKLIY